MFSCIRLNARRPVCDSRLVPARNIAELGQWLSGICCDEPFDALAVDDTIGPFCSRKGAAEGQVALLRDLVEAAQLDQGIAVVVDPNVKSGIELGALDQQGGRLPAPFVATRGLARVHRLEQ